jgi:hypothetical protein
MTGTPALACMYLSTSKIQALSNFFPTGLNASGRYLISRMNLLCVENDKCLRTEFEIIGNLQ